MKATTNLKTDPSRDATNSIRGYVYQIYQSLLAWIQLGENEILVLEGAEDFDIHDENTVTATQVKDVRKNITLRSKAVKDALNNFWLCRQNNPGHSINLRFLTTAEATQEKGAPFGKNKRGLEYWKEAETNEMQANEIKNFLLELDLEPSLTSFLQTATGADCRESLICRIKWDLGNKPLEALQYTLEDRLTNHGYKFQINSHDSNKALPHLLKEVADLLTQKGEKQLKFSGFLSSFDNATTVSIPRSKIEAMTANGRIQQISAMMDFAELSRLTQLSSAIGSPIPNVGGGISREVEISKISDLLQKERVVFLVGSSGLGKTNLASLLTCQLNESWGWAGFRGQAPSQVKEILSCATFNLNQGHLSPFFVLDDLDLKYVTQFERELISLVFSALNSDGMVIVTGHSPPPLGFLPKIWKTEVCEYTVPYFTEDEIIEMVCIHGLSNYDQIEKWARAIEWTTGGHPQLVHARVRNLSERGWPKTKMSDLVQPEDVERVRSEARTRLLSEVSTENTRLLAYRLSLLLGNFTREMAIAVADTLPRIALPGEAFNSLIGPWIEQEGNDLFRISPLLTGAAENILSSTDIVSLHDSISSHITKQPHLNQNDIDTALFHALKAKNINALVIIAKVITEIPASEVYHLSSTISWFSLVSLKKGQRILPGNPSIDLLLRIAQYKLIVASTDSQKALKCIYRIEESLQDIEQSEGKKLLEVMAYGAILNTIEITIPSNLVIRLLSRLTDLISENAELSFINENFRRNDPGTPRLGENKPEQVLFTFQASRLNGLEDLKELVDSLADLPQSKRDTLLQVCDSEIDFANLLISRAWWTEVDSGTLDSNKAIQVFNNALVSFREWKTPELIKACYLAISIIHDEYGDSTDKALEVLDHAEKEFPQNPQLIYQRAKVLFNAGRDPEALPLANDVLESQKLSYVDYAFCCRTTGISCAKSGDWKEAERFFRMGAEKLKKNNTLPIMELGFTADTAFALWKQKEYKKSLSLFVHILEALQAIPISKEDMKTRNLHATVRHTIAWIYANATNHHSDELIEPPSGMCSNQQPHEGIKDFRIVDLSGSWEQLKYTEQAMELDLGIQDLAAKATNSKRPLLFEGYARLMALKSVFDNHDFEKLIPTLISIAEAQLFRKATSDKEDDVWKVGTYPPLPDDYWEDIKHCEDLCLFILKACFTCMAENIELPPLIDLWKKELADKQDLPPEVLTFFEVLGGTSPNESLLQQAAAIVSSFRAGTVTPKNLWMSSFRLLNIFENEKDWGKSVLEKLLVPRWLFAAKNQRFHFSTPSLAASDIEKSCLDNTVSSMAKIASVLETSLPYLNIQLAENGQQMLKRIIENCQGCN